METFLQRYYSQTDRNLGDPHAASRYRNQDKYLDLKDIVRRVFEDLLNVTGQESMLGYTETEFSLVAGQQFYLLPEGYRQFISFQKISSQVILNQMGTRSWYRGNPGIQIIESRRGFRLSYIPSNNEDDWVMGYLRAPGLLHFAQATSVGETSITFGTPENSEDGEIIKLKDYYNGMDVRIVQADVGAGQQREILKSFVTATGEVSCVLRHPWGTMPQGDEIIYEVCPTLGVEYDSLYAMDAAILELNRREKFDKAQSFRPEREKLWATARNYFASNVMDRAPTRVQPIRPEDLLPTGEAFGQ